VILIYKGLGTPTVLAFGITDKFEQYLKDRRKDLPDKFFCHYQDHSRKIFTEQFKESDLGDHLKMGLNANQFRPAMSDDQDVFRLDQSYVEELRELYALAYPGNYYDPRMLDTGKYFGTKVDEKLVAVCGVHVYSTEFNMAVLGNITTH